LSVTSNFGTKPCLLSSLRISRNADRVSRRRWTSMSRISPSSSTARHRYIGFDLTEQEPLVDKHGYHNPDLPKPACLIANDADCNAPRRLDNGISVGTAMADY
jgi:hypothetical protein